MLTALYSAISGLSANGIALSVIGDNVANMNTVGFKGSRVAFGDVLSQTITGIAGNSQVGRGVMVSAVTPLFTQGSFETSASALDMAIDGEGFFIVSNGTGRFYTRAGQFTLDKDGKIVNPDGYALQGYLADASGNVTGTIGDMVISTQQAAANPTSQVNFTINLDARESVPSAAFTLDSNGDGISDDPANYNFSTQITVYDSQGNAREITAYFVKTATNGNQCLDSPLCA
ncbi:MAG: flagellar hook-basal body complex protein [Nitrospirae bacterium]|nr:flagellar hook-basal body complex protein [Nitrospirota bacterium]